jgi:ABC-type dipeptide/oligopeptide/nickel transport system permease subunit
MQLNDTPKPTAQQIALASMGVREHRSLWGDAWRRLISSNTARLGMAIVGFFVVATLLTHFFWEYDPRIDLDYSLKLNAPTITRTEGVEGIHPFGTDKLGRDIFRRVAHGGWNSLRVGIVAVGVALAIGGLLGLFAGFYESMPLDLFGDTMVSVGVAATLGAVSGLVAGQLFQIALFAVLGAAAPLADDLLVTHHIRPRWFRPGHPARIGLLAAAGAAIGAFSALSVGVHVAVVCGVLGLLTGGLVAFSLGGPVVSNVIMRLMDILLAFPGILLAIAIVAMLGPGLDKGMIAIGVVNIPIYARLMRSTVLSIVQQEYVTSARMVGVGQGRTLFVHILPNTLSPIIVQATMGLAGAILSAAALGFLGLGAIPPEPEWGSMLGDSYRFLTTGAWWAVLFPGLAIMFSVLGFNLLGDGLRDALDPKLLTD